MSARATAIAVVALLVLGVALIAQAWRMKDYSLNVSIARERQDDDPEMLCNYHRYFGATEVRFWSVAWICTGLLAQAGWVADDRRLAIGLGVVLAERAVADTLDWRSDEIRAHGYWPTSERLAALAPSVAFSFGYAALVLVSIPAAVRPGDRAQLQADAQDPGSRANLYVSAGGHYRFGRGAALPSSWCPCLPEWARGGCRPRP